MNDYLYLYYLVDRKWNQNKFRFPIKTSRPLKRNLKTLRIYNIEFSIPIYVKMSTEEIDDNEFFHQDFTTATEWEIFISRLEEIFHEVICK